MAADAVEQRGPSLPDILAAAGTLIWTVATSVARTAGLLDIPSRLALYGAGLATAASSVGLAARRHGAITTRDLVRDDRRAPVRVAFAGPLGLEDARGEPFVTERTETTTIVDLGDLGPMALASRSADLTSITADPAALDGLRLLAANHRALDVLRSQAKAIDASARRLELADALAANQLGSEIERKVITQIDDATAALARDPSPVAAESTEMLRHVATEVQRLAAGLGPSALVDGLVPALHGLADGTLVRVNCALSRAEEIDGAAAAVVYFAAAEAVTNAVRHARPTLVTVELSRGPDRGLELVVSDDGIGRTDEPDAGTGGLSGLRSRVAELGGTLDVADRAGRGTAVVVHLPPQAPGGPDDSSLRSGTRNR
jgi:signal transduction histidine kinase